MAGIGIPMNHSDGQLTTTADGFMMTITAGYGCRITNGDLLGLNGDMMTII